MSIDSPTLRSSSRTAPGPSLSRLPTSICARPSTAETCTGTSNTASRSAAPRSTGSLSEGASVPASCTTCTSLPFSRSGSGTLVSSSLIAVVSKSLCGGHITGRDITGDHLVNRRCRCGVVADDAAVGPLDTAVARRETFVGNDGQPAVEAGCARDLLDLFLRGLVDVCRNTHGDERGGHQMMKTFGRERRNFSERLARDERRRELGGDRDRHLDGFSFKAGFNCGEGIVEPTEPVSDHRKCIGQALGGLLVGLLLSGIEACPIGLRLGIGAPAFMLDQGDGRLRSGGEVFVEQIFGSRFHSLPFSHHLFRKPVSTFLNHARLSKSVRLRRGSWR